MNTRFGVAAKAALLAGLVAAVALPQAADARAGGGKSSGSRGSLTNSAPPSTTTAPRSAQPMQRTETPNVGSSRSTPPGVAPSRGMGFGGGLVAGLLGAGLFGMLFGSGFMGGLGGLASMFGLLLQVALVGGLVWLVLRAFRRRQEPALAGAGAPYGRQMLGSAPGGSGFGFGQRTTAPRPLEIAPDDYKVFERTLQDIQVAYGRGDVGAIRRMSTPEMARYFEQDLAEDRSRGVRNEVTEPKLLQGDLAQAWREGETDYATVAMRFETVDVVLDMASGRVVSGNRTAPTEATELWTFRRDRGGPWLLSGVQQTA